MLLEPDANKERDILSYFTDDTPALVEKQVGEGRVLFWASSLDRDWSDMAIRPGFVPLMNQVILYLTGRLSHLGRGCMRRVMGTLFYRQGAFQRFEFGIQMVSRLLLGLKKASGRASAFPVRY